MKPSDLGGEQETWVTQTNFADHADFSDLENLDERVKFAAWRVDT